AEFMAMMRAHPDVLQRIEAFTGGRVFGNRSAATSSEAYLEALTAAWFDVHAFDHIICGEPEPSGRSIGGLHFHGRYLQLQESGEACRMANYAQNEILPGAIYTMGVEMRTASGGIARHARKGYGLTLSGEDILKTATRAFAENPTGANESQGCLLPVEDDGVKFTAVFVRRAAGIRTFYPDATPSGRGSKPTPPCAAPIKVE
ncbi:MAG: EndoU domain-containing protein, partial [Hyphomicrobiaceae bacterium]|nr:EndoU domain-containing protein [Hyphomicrobiaceae bacterium]